MVWIKFITTFTVTLVGSIALYQIMPNEFVAGFILATIFSIITVRQGYGD